MCLIQESVMFNQISKHVCIAVVLRFGKACSASVSVAYDTRQA